MACPRVPMSPGLHRVEVTYDDVGVPKSPFRVGVAEGCDPTRVRAHGPGLEGGLVGKANRFTVETRWAPPRPPLSPPVTCGPPPSTPTDGGTSSPCHQPATSISCHWMGHLCPLTLVGHHLLAMEVPPPSHATSPSPLSPDMDGGTSILLHWMCHLHPVPPTCHPHLLPLGVPPLSPPMDGATSIFWHWT